MYNRYIETNLKNRIASDASLKVNAKERLALNALTKKRNKGGSSSSRAIIPHAEDMGGYAVSV